MKLLMAFLICSFFSMNGFCDDFFRISIEASGSSTNSWQGKVGLLKMYHDNPEFELLTKLMIQLKKDESILAAAKRTLAGLNAHKINASFFRLKYAYKWSNPEGNFLLATIRERPTSLFSLEVSFNRLENIQDFEPLGPGRNLAVALTEEGILNSEKDRLYAKDLESQEVFDFVFNYFKEKLINTFNNYSFDKEDGVMLDEFSLNSVKGPEHI